MTDLSYFDSDEWKAKNGRRGELIFKKNRGQLSESEKNEYDELDAFCLTKMQEAFPSPVTDEQIKRLEQLEAAGKSK